MGLICVIYCLLLPTAITLVFIKTANTSTSCIQWKEFTCPQGMKPTCISTSQTSVRKTFTFSWQGVPKTNFQNAALSFASTPCSPGLERNPDGTCPDDFGLGSRVGHLTGIRAPCPSGTRADQHQQCRQLIN